MRRRNVEAKVLAVEVDSVASSPANVFLFEIATCAACSSFPTAFTFYSHTFTHTHTAQYFCDGVVDYRS